MIKLKLGNRSDAVRVYQAMHNLKTCFGVVLLILLILLINNYSCFFQIEFFFCLSYKYALSNELPPELKKNLIY